ncbi:adhesion G-protein coupled receptor D1-like [Amphiura filiformis]|uniref:adhesion G-protein coupled receptor D1-like n=1 Tax=Amphiura filiformis TaxID=82378 RepID=UPI003B21A646
MATFFWMLVEGLYHAVKTSAALNRRNIPYAVWAAIGWGPALLIVIISAASRIDGYGYPIYEFVGDILTKRYRCWLDPSIGLHWAFVGPACGILAVNMCILIVVMRTYCTLKPKQNETQFEQIKSGIRVVFILGVILGLPWILGLLNLNEYTVGVSYFLVLANAFQGIYILLDLCLLDKEVQHILLAKESNRVESDTTSATEGQPISSRSTSREAWVEDDQNQQQQQESTESDRGKGSDDLI